MKKRIASAMLAALLVIMTGCGASGTSGETDSSTNGTAESSGEFSPKLDTEEEVTVNIIGLLENFESLEAVISDFQEYYPNCDVVYSSMTDDYYSVIGSRLESDDTVGIFMMDSQHYSESIGSFCANLNEEDIDFSAFRQTALDSYESDGVLYALPLALTMPGLIVNEDLLADEGLSIPENYAELTETCEKLKEAGYTPLQGYSSSFCTELMQSMEYIALEKAGDPETVLTAFASGDETQIELLRPSLERLSEIVEAGYVDMALNATYEDGYNATILKFFDGDVPFLVANTETFSGMKKRESKSEYYSENPFTYSFISAPVGDDGAYSYIKNWSGFCINESCPDKEWTVEFLRFLATEEEINQLASIKGLPSVAKESDDTRFENIYPENEDYLQYNDYYISGEVVTAIYNANNALGNGEVDVDGALAQIKEELTAEE